MVSEITNKSFSKTFNCSSSSFTLWILVWVLALWAQGCKTTLEDLGGWSQNQYVLYIFKNLFLILKANSIPAWFTWHPLMISCVGYFIWLMPFPVSLFIKCPFSFMLCSCIIDLPKLFIFALQNFHVWKINTANSTLSVLLCAEFTLNLSVFVLSLSWYLDNQITNFEKLTLVFQFSLFMGTVSFGSSKRFLCLTWVTYD